MKYEIPQVLALILIGLTNIAKSEAQAGYANGLLAIYAGVQFIAQRRKG